MQKTLVRKTLEFLLDAGGILFGCALYALSISLFIEPNEITPGGITGIATLLHHVFSLPTGIMVVVLNIPLIAVGWIKFGGRFILKTAIATAVSGILIDVFSLILPDVGAERMLAAVFGGLLMGTGIAIILLRGATTGGTDIAAKLLRRRFPHLSMGRLILLMDAVIIILTMYVFRNLESGLYSVIAIFVSTRIMDSLLYGGDSGKLFFIVTKKPDALAKDIFATVRRGVTRLPVLGGYSRTERTILMCAVRRQEVGRVRAAVRRSDPGAFFMVTEAGEIIGEGFKNIDRET